jgi:hypothetical protein
MVTAIAALAALYKPHMVCRLYVANRTQSFFSDTATTPDGTMITQRNYFNGFSEIISIAYDANNHRYVRTQLSDDGAIATATASAPKNGVWTWTSVAMNAAGKAHRVHFGIVNGKLRYWYENGAYAICT